MQPQDLYGLPLEQFTDRRNELARELRRRGRREQAAAVSKLRKPSVAAWAVNQLVRTQKREFDALLSAGDALQRAQEDLLANRSDAASLRRAVDAERTAVGRLAEKARGLLNADGHELTPARVEQVTETLHAAALDQDVRASVKDGCLERELRHVGLGGRAAFGERVGAGDAPAASGASAPASSPRRAARQRNGAAELKAARQDELKARRRLERAVQGLDRAAERRDRAAQELRDADGALEAARALATEAEREHRKANRRLGRA